MLRGSTPIRLSQLDISPAIESGALEQQAIVNMYSGIQQGIQNFQDKQEKKQQNEMTVNALKQFVPGLGDDVYKAISKDPQILKSMGDIANIQQARQEQEIIQREDERMLQQRDILEQAIVANTEVGPDGTINTAGVRQSFIDLGGTDARVLGDLYTGKDYKLDKETGLVLVDGKPTFQVSSDLLPPKPKTEDELKESKLRLEILEAERDLLLKEVNGGVTGTIDESLLTGNDLIAYNEAMKNPESEDSKELFSLLLADQQANR
jgi:hypothetical protein